MTDRELMQQALDALEAWNARGRLRIIEALRKRLTQCDRCGKVNPAEIHTCTPKKQEPVAWVDPTTLYQLKIGLEGVHLVYETEMINSLPLYEKPQGWRDNVAQAYLKGFDEGCKSISTRNGDATRRWSGKTENIGSLGMPVNVPVTPPQREEGCAGCGKRASEGWALYCVKCSEPVREWQGLTDEEIEDIYFGSFSISQLHKFSRAIEAKLKEKNT